MITRTITDIAPIPRLAKPVLLVVPGLLTPMTWFVPMRAFACGGVDDARKGIRSPPPQLANLET